ncbi:23S rRNA (guanosine(2251)-2'-O)-methyltransferase RlmB [Pseudoroseomonas cervicalis]|uniref:23S rRNA (guanosine(2251)-2'-O)-methyltransferase RlmB n=1 Tax=Teichococcus cervicalis TaxID=204525 RepID=UPI00278895DC|nr:23S rRNA (guanosine(2251)-2'-O)-methyltransferase RlmB [Pseudoroseomonas cervicalis]MDQ1081240.1 23S rRNA (guanosine2251-2'-O)-methyltransferase [Pseudoroseomonas cervicalis]
MSRPPRRPEGPRRPSSSSSPLSKGRSQERHAERPAGRPGHAAGAAPEEERPRRPRGGDAVTETPRGGRNPRGAEAGRAPREVTPPNTLWLYGLHTVAAALANPRRRFKRLLLTAEAEAALAEKLPKPWKLQAERVERARFQTFLTEDAVHQGAALLAEPLPPVALEDALEKSRGTVLLLDQVTDPRNVGAILRSAAAFGAAAVVMQDRNAPPETGAMARAAVGALDTVPVVREVNLARTITVLQKAGYWVMGLDGTAKTELAAAKPHDRPAALVLGAEDSGLRRLQRETCDELVKLPIRPEMESLNVSVAAAIALYELSRGG